MIHPFPDRTLTMIKFVLSWLHHCTCRRERGKCGPMTGLSLWKRTIDVKFICSVTSDCYKKKWTLYQGHQDAQDKQQTADAVSACSQVKVEDAPKLWKFPNRNVHTFGFVYHDTNGLSHGPVWKTQLFLLSEICTVILWQDCCVKGNLRKSY